jgi:hypothetical protein
MQLFLRVQEKNREVACRAMHGGQRLGNPDGAVHPKSTAYFEHDVFTG